MKSRPVSLLNDFTFADGSTIRSRPDGVANSVTALGLEAIPDLTPRHGARLDGENPFYERLYRVALADVESNVVETAQGRYFGAGSEFGPKVFTRDIAYSGILGLNGLFPELMNASLRYTRQTRRRVGFAIPRYEYVEDAHLPWEPVDLDHDQFVARYVTNSLLNRTDDVCWIWALGDLFERHPALADWDYLCREGGWFFETFYDRFFDPEDGLYRGQASFVDIGYPDPLGTGYEASVSKYDRIRLKVTSTNSLYLIALKTMARAAAQLGRQEEEAHWAGRAGALCSAMRRELLDADGRPAYYKRLDGSLETRQHALGTAFAVLSGVLDGDGAITAVSEYPFSDAGAPLFAPFYPDDRWYHNHSSWPFVDAFLLRARMHAAGTDERSLIATLMALTCIDDGRFHEVRDYWTRQVKGSSRQLWTAAAFLGAFDLDRTGSGERPA